MSKQAENNSCRRIIEGVTKRERGEGGKIIEKVLIIQALPGLELENNEEERVKEMIDKVEDVDEICLWNAELKWMDKGKLLLG